MLKNLPPPFTSDALHALASMGHGDDMAIVILRTGEQRKYGNILLRKGVISCDAE